ncbi:putative nuclear transport factor 2, partial [Caligus rogercresseyi]
SLFSREPRMTINPNYESIGKAFTQQYYALFDEASQRHQLVNLYNVSSVVCPLFQSSILPALTRAEQSLMSFEGQQMQGSMKIMEKIQSLTFQKIAHLITAVDCQPTFDGGVFINVLGQLK